MRAVLFDMDGVLVFSEDAWFAVYNETLAHFGHAEISRAAFDEIYGNGTAADRDAYMPERSVAEVDAAYERLFAARLDRIRPNPEAADVLRELRRMGVATSVATNTNRPLASRILEAQGLLSLVDAVTGADEAGAGKPDPAVVRLAAERAGAPLDACVFVGDSRFDEEAARRAPVRFLGYRYGSGERVESLEAVTRLAEAARTRSLSGP
ncbi:MAG: HAD family hydrolase [Acidobacteria bacterium]|nr:HAD family hydrolase [Acidobacteriota bacterium]